MNKIEDLILDVDHFINEDIQYNSYAFLAWYSNVSNFLLENYGKDSSIFKQFKAIKFATNMYEDIDCTLINQKACKQGLMEALSLLKQLR